MSAALRYVQFITTDDQVISYAEDAMVATPARVQKRAGDVHDSETVRIRLYNERTRKWTEHFATRQASNFRASLQRIDGEGAIAPASSSVRCGCGYERAAHFDSASGKRKLGACTAYTPAEATAPYVPPTPHTVAPVALTGDSATAPATPATEVHSTRRNRAGKGWARIQVKSGRIALELAPWIDPKVARRVASDALGMAEVLCDGEVRTVREQSTAMLTGSTSRSFSVESAVWLFVKDTDAAIACVTEYLLQAGYNVQK